MPVVFLLSDFVSVAREVFQLELEERSIELGAMLFAASDITDRIEPPPYRHEVPFFTLNICTPLFLIIVM